MTLQPPQPSRHRTTDSKERNYQQIRVRQDTNENWLKNDPKPASGEWCYSIGWANDPTTRDPANNDPPASKEWYGKFCVDADRNIWECTATSDGASPPNLVYNWEPVLEDGDNVKYTPPAAYECVKIGDSTTPWSRLPWLGGRGPQGIQGEQGDGIRIVGVLPDCGPPTAEQAPDPEKGDMWVVSCADRDDTSLDSCMVNCDGLAYVWDGTQWQSIGSIQGPAGNNVEYYYEDFTAAEGQTEFILSQPVQVTASFVTINGVVISPVAENYTLSLETLTITSAVGLKAGDIVGIFSFIGAVKAVVSGITTTDVQTVGTRPVGIPVPEVDEIKNQQDANWYLLDAVEHLDNAIDSMPPPPDLSIYETIVNSQAGDADTLAAANAYTDTAIGNIPPVDLSEYEKIAKSEADDAATLKDAKDYTDQKFSSIPAPDTSGFLKRSGDTTTGRLKHAGGDLEVFSGELKYAGPGQPTGAGEAGKCSVMNLEPEGDTSPVNELKFIVPNTGEVRDFLQGCIDERESVDLVLETVSGTQSWTGVSSGWFSPNSTYHLTADSVTGEDFTDGEAITVKAVVKVKYLLEGEVEDGGSNVTISPDEPAEKVEGDLWFDNAEDTMQLSVFHVDSGAWLPVAPPLSLEGRVSTGEAVQRQIVETLSTLDEDYAKIDFVLDVKADITRETDQKLLTYLPKSGGGMTGTISMGTNKITNLGNATSNKDAVNLEKLNAGLSGKIGDTGDQYLPTSNWKIRARKVSDDGNYSFIDIKGDKLHLYHIADPTNGEHALSVGYADGRYQIVQEPLVIKTTGSMECSLSNSPGSMKFCGLYNTSPGSSTNANEWFGNWNAGMRVNIDGMKTPDGAEFAQNQKFIFNGYITVVGNNNGKIYFKHAIDMIQRSGSDSYLTIHFSSRVPTYATGKYDAEDKYAVAVEGYVNKQVTTLNIPDEENE